MKVVIDCYFDELPQYRNGYTIVAVDVIRATTTAITGVSLGRKCYPVASIEEATALAQTLDDPLLVYGKTHRHQEDQDAETDQ